MSKIVFNEHKRRAWEANQNAKTVSNRMIQYTPEFKVKAVKENWLRKISKYKAGVENPLHRLCVFKKSIFHKWF